MILTNENFETEVLKSEVPVLVDVWAPWCGPCKAMVPVVDELEAENFKKAKVGKLNCDENPEVALKYQVRSIPAFFVFKGGEVVESAVGFQTKAALQAIIDKHV
jgi:thioredoxin 1